MVDASTPQVLARPAVSERLQKAREKFDARQKEYEECDLKDVPRATLELQRARIGVMLAIEADTGKVDDNIYREMSLLNRMIKQTDLSEKDDTDDEEKLATAEEKVRQAGLSPAAAKALVDMVVRGGAPDIDEDEDDAFDGPDPRDP